MTRILIVEDILQSRYMLEALLKGHGFEVTSTGNGAEALVEAIKAPPDLVISDILMPVMDGYELCRRWKVHDSLRQIPFIFYTATFIDLKDEQFALRLGAERFIVKPEKPEVLVQAIRDVLEEVHHRGADIPARPSGDELEILREYNEVLFHKLEKKVMELEADIAKREFTEMVLRESEERFRKVFESGTIGIALVGPDTRFIELNDEFCRMLGYSEDEMLPLGLMEISHHENRQVDMENMQRLKSGAISLYATENRYVKKDGSIVWSNTRVSTICDQNGQFSFFIVFATDITEKKTLEDHERQALLQIEENLEQLAALNDQIRNPLAIIVARIALEEKNDVTLQILEAVKSIDDLVTKLDERWAESAKVREFLLRHNQISWRM